MGKKEEKEIKGSDRGEKSERRRRGLRNCPSFDTKDGAAINKNKE